jgi:hypothetical protein
VRTKSYVDRVGRNASSSAAVSLRAVLGQEVRRVDRSAPDVWGPRPPDLEHGAIEEGQPAPARPRDQDRAGDLAAGLTISVVELGVHGRAGPVSSHIPSTVPGSSSSRR